MIVTPGSGNQSVAISQVPEPSSLVLGCLGVLGLVGGRRIVTAWLGGRLVAHSA